MAHASFAVFPPAVVHRIELFALYKHIKLENRIDEHIHDTSDRMVRFAELVRVADDHMMKLNEQMTRFDEHMNKVNEYIIRLDEHLIRFDEHVNRLDDFILKSHTKGRSR